MIRDFEYFTPETLAEAVALLDKFRDECKVIAGGQSLLGLMKQGLVAPKHLISLKGISALNYIHSDAKQGLKIGAMTTHRTIEKSPAMRNGFAVLADMERRLAPIQIRNWATIGGNLSLGDPALDPAPVLTALKATLKLAGVKGERTMPVEKFFLDYFKTALEPGELLTEIQVPAVPPHTGTAYAKFNLIQNDYATVGVAVSISLTPKSGTCDDVRIALGASAPRPMRAIKAEEVLRGKKATDSLLKEAGQVASGEAEPVSDIQASKEYRLDLIRILVARAGKEALEKARQS